jgi:hypothetical protein
MRLWVAMKQEQRRTLSANETVQGNIVTINRKISKLLKHTVIVALSHHLLKQ